MTQTRAHVTNAAQSAPADAAADAAASAAEYIAQFPPHVQEILRRIRELIREQAPGATERMGYGLPGFYLNGGLVWFGAFKNHVGFYPTPQGIAAFQEELAPYKQAKGSVQFPLDQPIPYDLIRRIVQHRVAENSAKKQSRRDRRAAHP